MASTLRSALPARDSFHSECAAFVLARTTTGIAQLEAAAAMGSTQSVISRSEQGERQVPAHELAALAALYGTAAEALAGPLTPAEQRLEARLKGRRQPGEPFAAASEAARVTAMTDPKKTRRSLWGAGARTSRTDPLRRQKRERPASTQRR